MDVIVERRYFPKDTQSSLLVATKSQVLGCSWKGLLEAAKAPALYAPERLTGSIRDDCDAHAEAKYPFLLSVVGARKFLD